MCIRYRKNVKFTYGLIGHINASKILIGLPTYQPSNLILILEYNMTNYLEFLSDNNQEDISLAISNNSKKKTRLAYINIDKENIRSAVIDN